jgi:hypothetical protein
MNIKILELERDLSDDTVITISWSATIQDGEYTVSTSGNTLVKREPDSATFILYKDLTEEKIIEWLEATPMWISPEDELKKEIEKLKAAPIYVKGLPWQL